jgi:long-chain acyl-CoA synthetase
MSKTIKGNINPMSDVVPSRLEAIKALSAPAAAHELVDISIDGNACRAVAAAPETLRDLFQHARQFGDLDYLVYGEERLSYTESWRQVARIANTLRDDCGVRKGDRVAIGMRNYPEWITSFLAITSIGGIAVALNALWNAEELAYAMELTGADILIADRERIERAAGLDLKVLSVRCPQLSSERITPLKDACAGASEVMPEVELAADDDAVIIFTSGSTGHPKAAVSSHRAVIHAVMSWDFDMSIALWRANLPRPQEPWQTRFRFLVTVPLFHVAGLHVGPISALWRGREIHLVYKWDPVQALNIIEREQITHFIAVPTMTGDLVRAAAEHEHSLDSLMSVGGGGAPRPSQQVRDIDAVFTNAAPGTGWGMTETNAIGAGIAGADYLQRPLSSGQCSALLDMRILDDEDRQLRTGQRGHLVIRGTSMFREYWNRPDANAEAFVDGWFRSGDIAYLDEEGFLFIVDRAKDIVIRGGENVGCGEVEDAIYSHPQVKEVVVFGVPHERLGEEVTCMIVTRNGESISAEELHHHLAQHLAEFQIPSRVFYQHQDLPRIASGKFNKRALRQQTIESLGLVQG